MANQKLTPEVVSVLRNSIITENGVKLPGQLNREIYTKVDRVLRTAGGRWDRKMQVHFFNFDPRPRLAEALESGVVIDEKIKYQAFFTSPVIADCVAALADVKGHFVLEPSAGEGALADACIRAGASNVACIEIHPRSAEFLRGKYSVSQGDFLTIEPTARFSRIVMNPPFTRNNDVLHVRRAYDHWLSKNGILVSVMLASTWRKDFQELVADKSHDIFELEAGAFKSAGTDVSTIIVKLEKREAANGKK